jgi:hypothetical protein
MTKEELLADSDSDNDTDESEWEVSPSCLLGWWGGVESGAGARVAGVPVCCPGRQGTARQGRGRRLVAAAPSSLSSRQGLPSLSP